ncbi:MAG TPA: tripartite tricarboxylate transporter TctB family protein [Usitatibacter sp.]|nr:tripartite tricarboxylate transporter TctB family protein [Usitatibacter sp.]
MNRFPRINKDYYAGALMLFIGLAAAIQGGRYQIGTLSRMGPGFFPMALGIILALIGVAIAATAIGKPAEAKEKLPPEWRGWTCIVASIVAFLVLAEWGGFIPATFAIVFVSAMGDRENTVKQAFLLSAAMCVLCWLVFSVGLKIPFPLFQWGGV